MPGTLKHVMMIPDDFAIFQGIGSTTDQIWLVISYDQCPKFQPVDYGVRH